MISLTVSPSPVIKSPANMPSTITATGTSALIARGGRPSFIASAASSSRPTVDLTGGAVTPVSRARRSATSIGPNSRPVVMTSTINRMAIKG